MKKLAAFFAMCALITMPVNAACSYTEKAEANTKAANIKINYEVVEDKQESDMGTSINEYFKISILNVTKELYVVVSNDVTNDKVTYTFDDAKDGVITFNWDNIETVTNFTFTIYASNQTPCYNEELKTIRKQTPRFNDFSNRAICDGMEDFYLCQKYTNIAEIDESMFIEKVASFKDGKITEEGKDAETEKKGNSIISFLRKNRWYIIGGLLVIATGSGVAIVIRNRKYREVK